MGIPAIHMTDGAELTNPDAVQKMFQHADPARVADYLIERARLGGYEGTGEGASLMVIAEYAALARRNETALIPAHLIERPPGGFRKIVRRIIHS